MKCDELKRFDIVGKYTDDETMYEFRPDGVCYDADEVDAEIAELKQKIEDAKATAYAESVDAGMRERRLKRALWLLNAEVFKWKALYFWYGYTDKPKNKRYSDAESKCRAMAEKFK